MITKLQRPKPHVWIVWGSCPDPGVDADYYEFDTEGEKAAFLRGVDESNGWNSWTEVKGPQWHQNDFGEILDGPLSDDTGDEDDDD